MSRIRRFPEATTFAAGLIGLSLLAGVPFVAYVLAQDDPAPAAAENTSETATDDSAETGDAKTPAKADAAPKPGQPDASGLIALNPKGTVKIDTKRKLVVVDGRIALRAGQLEMFACPAGTKEHESVIAVDSDAKTVHAALEAIGAAPGAVVQFDPEYKAAYGDVIDVFVLWKDADGKPHRVRGQSWVRDAETKEELKSDWVFGGSGFWTDPADGRRYYYADGGELICVSNFPTATMDLPIQSSQSNDSLLFQAYTERIPARGTPVRLVLRVPPNPDYPDKVEQTPNQPAPETSAPPSDEPATSSDAPAPPGEEKEDAPTDEVSPAPAVEEERVEPGGSAEKTDAP